MTFSRNVKKQVNNNYRMEEANRLIVTKWNKMRQKVLDEGKALEKGYVCKRREHLHTCVTGHCQIRMCVQRTCVQKWLKPSCSCWQVHTHNCMFNNIQALKKIVIPRQIIARLPQINKNVTHFCLGEQTQALAEFWNHH